MKRRKKSEALKEDAVIETYAVLEFKFEERIEDNLDLKFTITEECETDETLKLECEMRCLKNVKSQLNTPKT